MNNFCYNCGIKFDKHLNYCEGCGINFDKEIYKIKFCEFCGTKKREDGEFCEECGNKILSVDEQQKRIEAEEKRQEELKEQAEKRVKELEKEAKRKEELEKQRIIRRKEKVEKIYSYLRDKKNQKILGVILVVIILVLVIPFVANQIITMQENQRLAEEEKRLAEEKIKDEASAELLWMRTFGETIDYYQQSDSTLGFTSDGGYIITGGSDISDVDDYDVLLIKTDSNGVEQWNRTYDYFLGEFVEQISDGGYVIIGYDPGKSFIIKTDGNGSEQWNRSYSGNAIDGCQTNDGGFIIASSNMLFKIDENGNKLWNRTLGEGDAKSIIQTSDGGFIIAGSTFLKVDRYINGAHFTQVRAGWLVKTNDEGIIQWTKTFEKHFFFSVRQTIDGGYIIGSNEEYWNQEKNIANDQRASLIKTDGNGNIQWHNEYYPDLHFFTVLQTSDGGYVVAGKNYIYKTDTNGNNLWNKTYDSNLGIHSVIQDINGSFIISGSYTQRDINGFNNHDIFLLKTVGIN